MSLVRCKVCLLFVPYYTQRSVYTMVARLATLAVYTLLYTVFFSLAFAYCKWFCVAHNGFDIIKGGFIVNCKCFMSTLHSRPTFWNSITTKWTLNA